MEEYSPFLEDIQDKIKLSIEFPSMKPKDLIRLIRELNTKEVNFIDPHKMDNKKYVISKLLQRLGWHYLNMELTSDIHEKNKPLLHYLSEVGFKIAAIKTNDYNLFDIVGVERKAGDLLDSIFNEKIFQQITEGKDEYEYFYFVIGRSYTDVQAEMLRRGVHLNVLPGFVASCCKAGAPPLFIEGARNLADVLHYLAIKHYDGKLPRGTITTARIKSKSDRENRDIAALSMLCDGLTPEKAETLIAYAGGFNEAVELIEGNWENVPEADLDKHDLKGIFGPKRLKMVRDTLQKARGRKDELVRKVPPTNTK